MEGDLSDGRPSLRPVEFTVHVPIVEVISQCSPSLRDFQMPVEPTTCLILSERPLYFLATERSGDEITSEGVPGADWQQSTGLFLSSYIVFVT